MILNETQLDRDKELAEILGINIHEVQSKPIAGPESIRIYAGGEHPKDLSKLYEKFEYLDVVGYFRTLMNTSVTRRGKDLLNLLKTTRNKVCLDYGCGVGTHTIALLENQNSVWFLDVPGPLIELTEERIKRRGLTSDAHGVYAGELYLKNFFELVICTDVLEHLEDPIAALGEITNLLETGGQLHLRVSTMIKPSSGHFAETINTWKEFGPPYLKENYTYKGGCLWVKK